MERIDRENISEDYNKKLSSAQLRKIKKPIIERRRRCRINESLAQLKSLILEALNKDESQYNKMEKADILELTVKHLQTVHKQQQQRSLQNRTQHTFSNLTLAVGSLDEGFVSSTESSPETLRTVTSRPNEVSPIHMTPHTITPRPHEVSPIHMTPHTITSRPHEVSPIHMTPHTVTPRPHEVSPIHMTPHTVTSRPHEVSPIHVHKTLYKEGYSECMQEVTSYINNLGGVRPEVKEELTRHLSTRVKTIPSTGSQVKQSFPTLQTTANGYVQILPKDTVILNNDTQTGSVQSVPCVQQMQLMNGQTVLVANGLQTLVQPQQVLDAGRRVFQLVDRPMTQTNSLPMASNMSAAAPQQAVLLPDQSTSPLQVLTYNLSPQLSRHVTATSERLISPTVEAASLVNTSPQTLGPAAAGVASLVHASPQTLAPASAGAQTTSTPVLPLRKAVEKSVAMNVTPAPVKQHSHTKTNLYSTPVARSRAMNVSDGPSLRRHVRSDCTKRVSSIKHDVMRPHCTKRVSDIKHDVMQTINSFCVPQMNMHSYGIQQVSPTSDRMWRPW